MKFIVGALQQLAAEEQVIRHRSGLPTIDGKRECLALGNAIEKLRQKGLTIQVEHPKLDVNKVWATFVAGHYELDTLNGLELRTLCSSEETALRPEFIRAMERNPDKLKRPRCLYGLVNNYFALWRQMPNPDSVERLLQTAFASYGGKNPVVRRWSANKLLFSDQAATALAVEICMRQNAVDELLKTYCVEPTTKLGEMARISAANTAAQRFREMESSQNEEWRLQYLQWVIDKVLSNLTSPDAFCNCISQFILSQSGKESESFRHRLRSYVQPHKRLGDPRLRESSPHWRTMVPEAGQRYLSWLARDSIQFFFNTIVPDFSGNERRKDFWLQYHDAIKDFQVAVSRDDVWKLKSNINASDQIAYSQVDHQTTSAFLMLFEGYGTKYVIVEFSETGNAAYIFTLSEFEQQGVNFRSSRFNVARHLKFKKDRRIIHISDWERAGARMLSSELGIRP